MKTNFTIFLLCLFSLNVVGQEMSKMTDPRDGKIYNTVDLKITLEGGIFVHRVWMADNLSYVTENSVCYKNEPAYCDAFGRMYNWADAQIACPEGWHLATSKEWGEVIGTFGGVYKAGKALKKDGASNLSMLMGGFGDVAGVFSDVGKSSNYWQMGEEQKYTAPMISIHGSHDELSEVQIRKSNYNSCRCVANY
ncbi:MAG: FISUMP domain-containing protein [Cyclobacteriaceae bacterium]